MDFAVKKAENCFADAENYEYRIALSGASFLALLQGIQASTRVNEKLRRPTFYAELPTGVRVKGLMDKNVIKVGYLLEQAVEQKADFELWLREGCGPALAAAGLQKGEIVLDLGCGQGVETMLAAEQVGATGLVYGLDSDAEVLASAARRAANAYCQNVHFMTGQAEAIPLPDASIDAVFSNCVLDLVPNKKAAFIEIWRVLKPGGRIALADIVFISSPVPQEMLDAAAALIGCSQGLISREEYLSLLTRAGFTESRSEVFAAIPYRLIEHRAKAAGRSDELAALDRYAVDNALASVIFEGQK